METSGALTFWPKSRGTAAPAVVARPGLAALFRASLGLAGRVSRRVGGNKRMAAELHRQVEMKKQGTRESGFSQLELLIVVAVILVLAVIAVPSLLRSRIAANEASAVNTVRQISNAEMSYNSSYTAVGFAPDLTSLGGPVA